MIGMVAAILLAVPVASAPAAASVQAQFDAASAAVEDGRCAEAVAAFDALEARPATRRNPTVAGAIALRKGRCLADLGRGDEALAAIDSGLAAIGDAPAFTDDRVLALVARGRVAYGRFDYATATRDFVAARALAPPAERFEPLIWLIRATMFDEGDAARGYADEALTLAASREVKPQLRAAVRTLHARVLLNHGDVRGGFAELRDALGTEGGLTLKVNAAMIGTRSDLALAALLNHNEDSAREYLAYTGAGHGNPFGTAADMDPPACDGVDLKPDDSAVVEFGIKEDGSVLYAVPVYASRLGPTAVAFARAVAGWSWKPEALAKISPLFRLVTRVQLRCSKASESPPVIAVLNQDLGRWLARVAATPFTSDAAVAARVPLIRAELARRRAAGRDLDLIPLLDALGKNAVVDVAERRAALVEARDLAVRNGAPPAVTTLFAVAIAGLEGSRQGEPPRNVLRDLLATAEVAGDPHSRAVVRLLLAEPRRRDPAPADADALLAAVRDDPGLPPHDPLRSAAQVRLASLLLKRGDLPAARAAYEASGVGADQCALVDAKPVGKSLYVSEGQFPKEALRWGFEGWVRLEFDVAADGRLAGQRAVVAYPPFVFVDGAIAASRNWRYEQTFRADGAAGCSGAHQQIHFSIAR